MNPAEFEQHRGLLFTLAYDITGSVADAEDVVQDVGVRWLSVAEQVENPRAYLARMAANRSLNLLRSNRRRREEYVGSWLPEPLPTDDERDASPETSALTADAVSTAMLVVLQSLTEHQRAAFILREVFGFEYREVADVVDTSETNARQLVTRARAQVRAGRQRSVVDAELHQRSVARFAEAAAGGDLDKLIATLAPDAVLITDSDGRVSAARRPIHGSDRIARFLLGLIEKNGLGQVSMRELNGMLAAVVLAEDGTLTSLQFDVSEGVIQTLYVVRNPEKLAHLV